MGAAGGSSLDPSAAPTEGAAQILPKEWIIGRDLTLVEKPIVYRDGDSIQGSHVTTEKGSYVLQWKWFEGKKSPFLLISKPASSKFWPPLAAGPYSPTPFELVSVYVR